MSWSFTFTLLNTMIYTCYGVIARYVYIINKRMVLEDIEDRTIQMIARVISVIFSGISIGIPIAFGNVPFAHIR